MARRGGGAAPFTVWQDGEAVPPSLRGAVLAIGNFDGLHRGHQRLVEDARAEGTARGVPAAVLTFSPHPRAFFAPDAARFDLTPLAVKLRLFRAFGLDGAFVKGFDAALAGMSPEAFVSDFLVGTLGVSSLVVGADFHFGRGRSGTPATLADLAARRVVGCRVAETVTVDGEPVSSSRIRAALEAGRIGEASRLLGYRWVVAGLVVPGAKLGRTLGFPTANLRLPATCRLAHGIYAVRVDDGSGTPRDGVASFGRRPTFDDGEPLLEVHLFDFAGDLYGRDLLVEFVGWLRGEERFASANDLVVQMNRDAAEARALLAEPADPTILSVLG